MTHIVLFDTETTGLLKPDAVELDQQPQIIEFSAVKIDENFNLIVEMNFFLDPGVPLPPEIPRITGIQQSDLKGAKTFEEMYPTIARFFTGVHRLVAHNLAFDRGMLYYELKRIERELQFPWPYDQICTVEASMGIEQRRINLSKLHTYATGKPHEGAHRAKADVYALVRCYHYLCEKRIINAQV